MTKVTLRCDHCGGQCEFDSDSKVGFCIHCGTKVLIQPDIYNVTVNVGTPGSSKQTELMWRYASSDISKARTIADVILRTDPFNVESMRVSFYGSMMEVLESLFTMYSGDPHRLYADCKMYFRGKLTSVDGMFDIMVSMFAHKIRESCSEKIDMYEISGASDRLDGFDGLFPYNIGESNLIHYLEESAKGSTPDRSNLIYQFLARIDPGCDYGMLLSEMTKSRMYGVLFGCVMHDKVLP